MFVNSSITHIIVFSKGSWRHIYPPLQKIDKFRVPSLPIKGLHPLPPSNWKLVDESYNILYCGVLVAGGGGREQELMLAVQLLLDKLNSGQINISPEMLQNAREGKVTNIGSTSVHGGSVQVRYCHSVFVLWSHLVTRVLCVSVCPSIHLPRLRTPSHTLHVKSLLLKYWFMAI